MISDANAVRAFRKSRVAQILEEFIEEQRKGQMNYLQVEIGSLNGLNIFKFFGAFLKYVYMLQENRAYRKIEALLDNIEQTGLKYERQRRKEEDSTRGA